MSRRHLKRLFQFLITFVILVFVFALLGVHLGIDPLKLHPYRVAVFFTLAFIAAGITALMGHCVPKHTSPEIIVRPSLEHNGMNVVPTLTEMSEEKHYEAVMDELTREPRRKGLWAKSLAMCEGNEDRAQHCYIKLRVDQRISEETQQRQQSQATTTQLRSEKNWKRSIQWMAFCTFLGVIIWVSYAKSSSLDFVLENAMPQFVVNCFWTLILAALVSGSTKSGGITMKPNYWRNFLVALGSVEAIHAIMILASSSVISPSR